MQTVKELTSFILHKHYCENDMEAIIELLDDRLSWFGAGENEYAVGTETVSGIFRQFAGMIPKCNFTVRVIQIGGKDNQNLPSAVRNSCGAWRELNCYKNVQVI